MENIISGKVNRCSAPSELKITDIRFTDIVGGGFHKWPGSINKSIFGKDTASGGCVRLTNSDAEWIYKHVPVKSTVYVY